MSEVNVLDFHADPTGVADSAPAFMAAIDSFSPTNDAVAGTVVVPIGIYRLASPVRIKKSVWIRGTQAHSREHCTRIQPDSGIEAFVFERYNTPVGTMSAGAGDSAQISNLVVQPAGTVPNWVPDHTYNPGDKVRTGTGAGESWRRHYVCTSGGRSASDGIGPWSLGNDKLLRYRQSTAEFSASEYVTGLRSRAEGVVVAHIRSGEAGQLRLTSVTGTFDDGEAIADRKGGQAVADGPSRGAGDDEPDGTARWRYLGSGAGIRIRANGVTLRDVAVLHASGNGVHIEAQDPESPGCVANANGWHLQNVDLWFSGGHGLYVNGSDANGGSYIHGVLYCNGSPTSDEDFTGQGYNIYDSSFLGNTYVAVQMGSGGRGSVYTDNVGGGSTFIGCYQEGTGGGENVASGSCVIVGGGLSASIFSPDSVPVTIAPPIQSRGLGHKVVGHNGAPWRAAVAVILGNRRANGGRLYEVTSAGTTATSGGPTGTGSNIADGTARWRYIHDVTRDGYFSAGSAYPHLKTFFAAQAPEDVIVGLPTFYRHDSMGGCTGVHGYQYGISGAGGESGPGLMHAVNDSKIDEWPLHVPAGRAIFEFLWVGACRIAFGGGVPDTGTWNPGDRIYYKGAAVIAGGAEGLVCIAPGTAGVYGGGRTAASRGSATIIVSGETRGTLRDQQDFRVGDMLTIGGVTSRILSVSADGLTLVMSSTIPAGTSLRIQFATPKFQSFGTIAGGGEGDSTGSPGNATLHARSGRSAIAVGTRAITIANDRVTPSRVVHATLQTIDAALTQILAVIPGMGFFVISANADALAPVTVAWSIADHSRPN